MNIQADKQHWQEATPICSPQIAFAPHGDGIEGCSWSFFGLPFGGVPLYPGKQAQATRLLLSLHWLFRPQGDGSHGLFSFGIG